MQLWDGIRQPGMYWYPPNQICGHYDSGKIHVTKFFTDKHAEVEFWSERAQHTDTFTIEFKYVNIESESATYPKQIWHHKKLVENSG